MRPEMNGYNRFQRIVGYLLWIGGLVAAVVSLIVGADTDTFQSYMFTTLVGWMTVLSADADRDRRRASRWITARSNQDQAWLNVYNQIRGDR